jgi:type IV secretion system protein VirB9
VRNAIAIMACIVALFGPGLGAGAEEAPLPGATDPRIRTVFYDPDQVVAIRGYFGFQIMIEFGPDERIQNVSIGDGLSWQVTPNHKASLLFLKPIDGTAPTNMTVVTQSRRYVFELSARRARSVRPVDMAYVVRFLYPPEPPPPPPPFVTPPEAPQRQNVAYTYTGARELLPSLVFDDGRSTYFQWPSTAAIPAIFLVGSDGAESIVNFTIRDGFLVVEQLAPKFALRTAKELTLVINDAWRDPLLDSGAPHPHVAPRKHGGMMSWFSRPSSGAPLSANHQ